MNLYNLYTVSFVCTNVVVISSALFENEDVVLTRCLLESEVVLGLVLKDTHQIPIGNEKG